MSKKPEVFTVRHGDKWANRRAGSNRVSRTYRTKKEAQEAGRKTAQRERTDHVIQSRDGKNSQRNSYGNDPHPPKG